MPPDGDKVVVSVVIIVEAVSPVAVDVTIVVTLVVTVSEVEMTVETVFNVIGAAAVVDKWDVVTSVNTVTFVIPSVVTDADGRLPPVVA